MVSTSSDFHLFSFMYSYLILSAFNSLIPNSKFWQESDLYESETRFLLKSYSTKPLDPIFGLIFLLLMLLVYFSLISMIFMLSIKKNRHKIKKPIWTLRDCVAIIVTAETMWNVCIIITQNHYISCSWRKHFIFFNI